MFRLCVTVVRDSVSLYACNFGGTLNLSSVPLFALERTCGHEEGQVLLKMVESEIMKGWGDG